MSLITEVFGSGFDLYKFLSQKARTKSTYKKLLVRELKNNMERLEHRNKKGVNKPVLIQKLENTSILAALTDGYNMDKLAPKQLVDSSVIEILSQAKRYKGWDAEKIILSIDEKIVSLKDLGDLYDDLENAPINLASRLNNLYILCVLLSLLIKKSH